MILEDENYSRGLLFNFQNAPLKNSSVLSDTNPVGATKNSQELTAGYFL